MIRLFKNVTVMYLFQGAFEKKFFFFICGRYI